VPWRVPSGVPSKSHALRARLRAQAGQSRRGYPWAVALPPAVRWPARRATPPRPHAASRTSGRTDRPFAASPRAAYGALRASRRRPGRLGEPPAQASRTRPGAPAAAEPDRLFAAVSAAIIEPVLAWSLLPMRRASTETRTTSDHRPVRLHRSAAYCLRGTGRRPSQHLPCFPCPGVAPNRLAIDACHALYLSLATVLSAPCRTLSAFRQCLRVAQVSKIDKWSVSDRRLMHRA
jgi:hypothetical protein